MKIDYNQRRIFYDWLSKVHGYGAIAPGRRRHAWDEVEEGAALDLGADVA